MIIALKTRKLLIKIAIGEARTGGEGGGCCESFCVQCNLFFGGVLFACFLSQGFSPGLRSTASSGSKQVFFASCVACNFFWFYLHVFFFF